MSELDRAYDPDPLEVGTRVRTRMNGECEGVAFNGGAPLPHLADHDGVEGTVIGLAKDPPPGGHRYLVQWTFAGTGIAGALFARTELERLP